MRSHFSFFLFCFFKIREEHKNMVDAHDQTLLHVGCVYGI